MSSEVLIASALGALLVSALLTWQFSRPGSRFRILDYPNERSLHTRPTPRAGGIAIVIACLLVGTVLVVFTGQETPRLAWLAGAALFLATTSFIDDHVGLTAGRRMIAHLIVAAALLYGRFVLDVIALPGLTWMLSAAVAVAVTLLYVIWMVNLYNFMDGMDGFAGGMSVIGFGTFAWLGWTGGQPLFAGLNLVIASASAGFLFFNFPPARIFMGDVGSSTLGFAAAAMSLWAHRDGLFPLWISVLLFSPFIADATVTLACRLLRGEKVWRAHKTHYYQQLVQLGWGHRKTVLWEYVLMLACAATAVGVARQSPSIQWLALGVWVAIYVLLALLVTRLERRAAGAVQKCRV